MNPTQSVHFHEATLTAISAAPNRLVLEFEDARVGEHVCNASIRLEGIRRISRDGELLAGFDVEAKDCEILTLEFDRDHMFMVVEWTDFTSQSSHTRSYHFDCESLEVKT